MLAIADERISNDCKSALKQFGYSVLTLPSFPLLSKPVSSHPDMLIFIINNTIITHKLYYDIAKTQIDKISKAANLKLILSYEKVSCVYPDDVLFNGALVGNRLIGNLNFLSMHIKEQAKRSGIELIHTNQGYAKCSLCPVSDNAIITADNSVFEAAQKNGIDVLKITEGYIELKGYNYGFIGGAAGVDRENVYFCGHLENHPNGKEINAFLKKYNKKAVSLSKEKLYDFGTVMLIDKK